MNTKKRVLCGIGLACFLSTLVFGLDSDQSNMDRLLDAERDLAMGESAAAYRSYSELIELVSNESPLRIAAWRGRLLTCPNGEELHVLLTQLLEEESTEVQRKTLPVLNQLRLSDEAIDEAFIAAVETSDATVGVVLVELLSDLLASGFLPRMLSGFSGFDYRVNEAIIEAFPEVSENGDLSFLLELIVESGPFAE